jgi:UDPglucose 6-dehydrogenase
VRESLKSPVIFDGRNLYDPQKLESIGITYFCIGRGASVSR